MCHKYWTPCRSASAVWKQCLQAEMCVFLNVQHSCFNLLLHYLWFSVGSCRLVKDISNPARLCFWHSLHHNYHGAEKSPVVCARKSVVLTVNQSGGAVSAAADPAEPQTSATFDIYCCWHVIFIYLFLASHLMADMFLTNVCFLLSPVSTETPAAPRCSVSHWWSAGLCSFLHRSLKWILSAHCL